MKHLWGTLTFVACLGCGAGEGEPPNTNSEDARVAALAAADEICDGSDDIRFGIATVGGGPLGDGDFFYAQNGHRRVIVDGQCQMWTHEMEEIGPRSYLRGRLRRGALTRDELADLLQTASWDRWEWFSEQNVHTSCNDAPGYTLRNEVGDFGVPSCLNEEEHPDATAIAAAISSALSTALETGRQNAPSEGDIRYRVVPQMVANTPDFVQPWPGDLGALSSAVHADGYSGCPDTTELATGAEAELFRTLRTEYISEAEAESLQGVVVTDGTETRALLIRDVGPAEDKLGFSSFPGSPVDLSCD